MVLSEAKKLADRLSAGKATLYTVTDMQQAVLLLERTSRGRKTQKAWDRLDRRVKALGAAIAARRPVAA